MRPNRHLEQTRRTARNEGDALVAFVILGLVTQSLVIQSLVIQRPGLGPRAVSRRAIRQARTSCRWNTM